MHPALGLLIAYLLGSVPSAYLAGRVWKGVDLRTVGSGNLGATNVYRALGVRAALVVLALDAAKGAVPVFFLPRLLLSGGAPGAAEPWWALAYGGAAIVGHAKPVFLLWRGGGKGVATAAGMFGVLAPVPLACTAALCAAVVWYSGYMSLGSVVAAILFPLLVWLEGGVAPTFWASLLVGAFVVWSHRSNLRRLRAGTEHPLFPKRHGTEREP
ncbi:MAG TPA: glycerol-3-phosphate 1-O-acyltransferase PlsY [Gemmatimonadaceae bacterium]|nr:glycerol-3-phosphate 1-O-acyltransferase PlsY [Gemmatimonadaceae bacterium]